jgi:uncharacterized protein
MTKIGLIAAALATALAVPASAQSPVVSEAISAGQVGERFDGYMGFVGTPSAELRRQVLAINIQRRKLYIGLASRRNVTAQLVGMATACQLLGELSPGEAYMLSDGVWRRRIPAQPLRLPDYCR